jgi:hypothetical protein
MREKSFAQAASRDFLRQNSVNNFFQFLLRHRDTRERKRTENSRSVFEPHNGDRKTSDTNAARGKERQSMPSAAQADESL